MYHKIEDQEKNPDNYVLTPIDSNFLEDECYSLFTKPKQTQRTIGLYLKKIKDADEDAAPEQSPEHPPEEKKRFKITKGKHDLEKEVIRNKGLWVGRPETSAPLIYKLKEKYSVKLPKNESKEQGIFYRSQILELDYLKKLAKAGLLYPDEELTDSEEEIEPDNTLCVPLRKTRYKICDPCKPKKEKKEVKKEEPPKDLIEEIVRHGIKPPFKKIPTGCQCDYYGAHNQKPMVWDNPFKDRLDMLRQHEMDKVMRAFKCELLNQNYEKSPPVVFMPHEFGTKKTFPHYSISNL